ncbi:MAG: hypothetical protein MZV64_19990 [Ignavibacteriales bacterium]|nr:hypothetical protein [Ignavibacteriales bacterium]
MGHRLDPPASAELRQLGPGREPDGLPGPRGAEQRQHRLLGNPGRRPGSALRRCRRHAPRL